ncbi:PREDICTED: solute carrier family 13 member 5-like isoform X2 [Branchiostoma belcheri]|uniref:Solute carrier family 13 member 5-like isoform X2 n=1 Tax=Branchiostoma belcheri TaxID=7741 RepID=A0A6P4Y073_BRABE|nr:PREDICTED: solute carrier family 13 member 5-like isoform X2 [Branchiostoma belcheri]
MAPRLVKELRSFWKSIVFFLTPVILCPLPIYFASTEHSKIAACAYAVIIMAVYWTTEVLPLAVTALLPIILFPMLGVQPSKDVCINYLRDNNFLFVGGLLVAVAIERWNLHKRIALRVLLTVGSEPRWLMLGMMSATAFLSMLISNTATTAMMVPIAQAILSELLKETGRDEERNILSSDEKTEKYEDARTIQLKEIHMEEGDNDFVEDDTTVVPEEQVRALGKGDKIGKGLLLCICYAANIGGTATLTGTGPNLVITQAVDTLFPGGPGIDFVTWFTFGFPCMVLALILAWIWLQCMFLDCRCLLGCIKQRGCKGRCKRDRDNAAYRVIRKQYDELGPVSFAEKVVLFHFVLLVLLWFFRDMKFVKLQNKRAAGWTYFFQKGYMTDAATGIMVAIVLFFWPSQPPNFMCCRRRTDTRPAKPAPPILDWATVHQKMPWSVVILLGGGFALADGVKASGLSDWMGQGFRTFAGFPVVALALIISIIVAFITEFTSNTSTAAIFLPILGKLVSGLSIWLSDAFTSLAGVPPAVIALLISVIVAFITEFTSNVSTASIFLPIIGKMAEGICVHPYYLMIPATIACSFAFMLPVATPPNAIVFSYGRIKVLDMVKCGFMLNLGCILVLTFAINTYGIPLYGLGTFPSWATCAASSATQLPANITSTVLPANLTLG